MASSSSSSPSSSSSSMLQPTLYGGYGRQAGIYGGLKGVEFAARCPPDVQRNTRIVAVCGIPEKDATPEVDGWFFSDFFLFYQMLSSRPELPNQSWLSSCSPSVLIEKHKRYVHGPAGRTEGSRRIVMDKTLLPRDEMQSGFRIVPEKELLNRFLSTLIFEIQEAAKAKQPMLVLIFGHGQEETSGIFIGCEDNGKFVLTGNMIASVLQKNVPTTMIMTSCYSGGWIMKPNIIDDRKYDKKYNFDSKPGFNHTFLTAAGYKNESISWELSQTIGRQAGGSVFATCLLNSIITACDRTEGFYNGEKAYTKELNQEGRPTGDMIGKLVKVREEEGGEEMATTMAALTQQIVYECEAQYGSLWEDHNFSFATQDDLWAQVWGKRTGLPLLNYKEKWEALPIPTVTKEIHPPAGHRTGCATSKSPEALNKIVRVKAARYMKSNPGQDNSGCNTNSHPYFRRLIEGHLFDTEDLERLNEILDYRQGQMGLAEIYCYRLEIDIPMDQRLEDFNEAKWLEKQYIKKRGGNEDRSKAAINLLERFEIFKGLIMKLGLFDAPRGKQGLAYSKPKTYLAARLADTPIEIEDICKKLEDLLQQKLRDARNAAKSDLGAAILSQESIKMMRGRLYSTVGRLRHRLRSLSPRKRSFGTEVEV